MESLYFGFCRTCCRTWLVSLVVFVFTPQILLFSSLQSIDYDLAMYKDRFDRLEASVDQSNNVLYECYLFLKSFVFEINSQYNTDMKFEEAIAHIKQNIKQFNFTPELEYSICDLIHIFENIEQNNSKTFDMTLNIQIWRYSLYPPWKWNWFGYNRQQPLLNSKMLGSISSDNFISDPPDGLVIGLVEIFAGALLCIIPHPVTYTIGGGLILDGVKRALDGSDRFELEHQMSTLP